MKSLSGFNLPPGVRAHHWPILFLVLAGFVVVSPVSRCMGDERQNGEQSVLGFIAKNDEDHSVRQAAVEAMNDQLIL